jgi:ribonuclease P protein component
VTSAPASSATPGGRLATRDFDRIHRSPSRRQRSGHFLVLARQRPRQGARWGISIKARLGNAVVRNRIRRRVREALRHASPELMAGWDVVVQPRSASVATADFAGLSRELERLLAAALGDKQ